jgi:hypothetical protein
MSDNFLVCQVRAVTEYAVTRHRDVDLREILDALEAAREAVQAEMAWRQIHGGNAA